MTISTKFIFIIIRAVLKNPFVFVKIIRERKITNIDLSEIEKYLTSNSPLIVEAGVADASDTLRFIEWKNNCKIIGFEPSKLFFNIAKTKTSHLKQVNLFNMALGPKTLNNLEFYTSSTINFSSSLLRPSKHLNIFPKVHFNKIELCNVTSLDDFFRGLNFPIIDLLWLDLQGLEFKVLNEGSTRTLQRTKLIHLEVSRISLYEGDENFEKIDSLLLSHDYKLILRRMPFVSGNALYLNRKYYAGEYVD
jgi:FkbM family methyltransferase